MAQVERDPYTGYLTTGHEWNGITELNRPVPKVIWLFIAVTVTIAVIMWLLLPAWPLWVTYTHGLLGIDQRDRVERVLAEAADEKADSMNEIAVLPFDDIQADPVLMGFVRQTGTALFGDNCAACHGVDARGGPGYPSLTDNAWLWGGDPETVQETLRVGINSDHPETRASEMLAFAADGILDRQSVADVVTYVQSLSDPEIVGTEAGQAAATAGAGIFADNCAACHGDDGKGSTELGAPDLTDGFWIYGGDRGSIMTSVQYGRHGWMPQWEHRLSPVELKILTLYLLDLEPAGG